LSPSVPSTSILLVAPESAALPVADALRHDLHAEVEMTPSPRSALASLRRNEFSLILIDESLATPDTASADLIYQNAGGALVVELNFAISSAARIVRQTRAALARLAAEQDAELLLVDAPDGLLEDARLTALLENASCDVAVVVPGEQRDGPVLVTFAGADHDWAAVELGARYSGRTGSALVLLGALTGDRGRDASRLLANASLAVQRALGVAAEPRLVEPDPAALVAASRDARLVLVGLTERWRQEGIGRARTALATAGGHHTLLVRRGLRPGGLAARDPGTRFTWTVAAQS